MECRIGFGSPQVRSVTEDSVLAGNLFTLELGKEEGRPGRLETKAGKIREISSPWAFNVGLEDLWFYINKPQEGSVGMQNST